MNQKERLEMIRRKRLREQRRRKFLIRRVFVFAVAIIIAALVIFAIKGCVSSVSQRAEQKRQEELAAMSTQMPTTAIHRILTKIIIKIRRLSVIRS